MTHLYLSSLEFDWHLTSLVIDMIINELNGKGKVTEDRIESELNILADNNPTFMEQLGSTDKKYILSKVNAYFNIDIIGGGY